jgi:hypothetical protein
MGHWGGKLDVLPIGGESVKSSFDCKKCLREHLVSLGADKLADLLIGLVEDGEEV